MNGPVVPCWARKTVRVSGVNSFAAVTKISSRSYRSGFRHCSEYCRRKSAQDRQPEQYLWAFWSRYLAGDHGNVALLPGVPVLKRGPRIRTGAEGKISSQGRHQKSEDDEGSKPPADTILDSEYNRIVVHLSTVAKQPDSHRPQQYDRCHEP